MNLNNTSTDGKNRMKKILGAGLILLIASGAAFAAKIHLKNGEMVEGKIIGRNTDSVVLQQGVFPKKYYHTEIDVIEEDVEAKDYGKEIPKADQLTREQRQLIYQLLDKVGIRKILEDNLKRVIDSAPEDKKTDYMIALNSDDIFDLLVPIYSKYYTNEELKALIKFYESPAGQKYMEVTPLVAKDTLSVTLDYFKEKLEPIK
jgi:hypothetical protein